MTGTSVNAETVNFQEEGGLFPLTNRHNLFYELPQFYVLVKRLHDVGTKAYNRATLHETENTVNKIQNLICFLLEQRVSHQKDVGQVEMVGQLSHQFSSRSVEN